MSNHTAFRALYEAHVDFVWRNLRRLGIPESDTPDKTQEVFVVAHKRFGEFEEVRTGEGDQKGDYMLHGDCIRRWRAAGSYSHILSL